MGNEDLGRVQGPTFFVSDLRTFSSQPVSCAFQVCGTSGKNSLQVAFLIADISTDAHSISTYQGRQYSFHPRTMLSVVFFEGLCFLSRSGDFSQFIVGTDPNRSSTFACATARAQFAGCTSFQGKSKTQAVINGDRICCDLAFWTDDDIVLCINLKM